MGGEPPPPLPRIAVRLGFLGLAPLAISALVSLYARAPDVAHLGVVSFAIYAAALLSFLGGVRCGFELMAAPASPSVRRLFLSALPVLAGWALALFVVIQPSGVSAAAAFAGLFALQQMWDHRSAEAGAPAWYPMLRRALTGGTMIICLLVPLAAALRGY